MNRKGTGKRRNTLKLFGYFQTRNKDEKYVSVFFPFFSWMLLAVADAEILQEQTIHNAIHTHTHTNSTKVNYIMKSYLATMAQGIKKFFLNANEFL